MLAHVSLVARGSLLSTLRRALVALGVTLSVGLVPAAPAAADQSVAVPDGSAVILMGDGYGHGIGMSQYGAYSAAYRAELRYPGILRYYYRGVDRRFGEAGGQMKIRISADDSTLVVDDASGLTFSSVRTGRSYKLEGVRAARHWRVRAVGAGDR